MYIPHPQENSAVVVKTALDVLMELYRRGVWHDAKTVNVITTACFSKITKVMVAALKFFLGMNIFLDISHMLDMCFKH